MKKIDNIKQLLASGKAQKSFSAVIELIESSELMNSYLKDIYDETILLSGRFNSIEQEIRLGIISRDDEQLERNKINKSLIEVINQLSVKLDSISINEHSANGLSKEVRTIRDNSKFDYDVFLSFSSQDLKGATELFETLVGFGFKVFISSEFFKNKVGSSFQNEIEYALNNSKNFLLYWTNNASKSRWVELEYLAFFNEFYVNTHETNREFYIFNPKKNYDTKLPLLLRSIQSTSYSKDLVTSILRNEKRAHDKDQVPKHNIQEEEKIKKVKDSSKGTMLSPLKENIKYSIIAAVIGFAISSITLLVQYNYIGGGINKSYTHLSHILQGWNFFLPFCAAITGLITGNNFKLISRVVIVSSLVPIVFVTFNGIFAFQSSIIIFGGPTLIVSALLFRFLKQKNS